HDRPLHGGFLPAALGLLLRQLDDLGAAEVHLEFAVLDKHAAPDDFAFFGDAAEGAAAEAEIHAGLAQRVGAGPAADVVRGRGAAGDEEHPDVVVGGAALVPIAPAQVMERVFDGLAEGLVNAVGEEAVEAGAFVHFVEVRDGFAGADDFALGVFDGRTVAVVERAFDEVGGGEEILEALLVLDADGLAAEFVGDAHGG